MNVCVRRNNGVFEAESRLWYAPLTNREGRTIHSYPLIQGMLYSRPPIHLRLCPTRRVLPKAPEHRRFGVWMGYCRTFDHDQYGCGLCVLQ